MKQKAGEGKERQSFADLEGFLPNERMRRGGPLVVSLRRNRPLSMADAEGQVRGVCGLACLVVGCLATLEGNSLEWLGSFWEESETLASR